MTEDVSTDGGELQLLYTPEVAKLIRRSEDAVRIMRHMGTGPKSAKVGGRVMYRKSDVVAWVEAEFAKADRG